MSKVSAVNEHFSWDDLGDIETGRPNLGQLVPVSVYRLMQFTMRHIIAAEFGKDAANTILFKSVKWLGRNFARSYWIHP